MASIHREVRLAVPAARAWAALRDVGNAVRCFPGVLTESRLDGDVRAVKFANGLVAQERIVDVDDARRRVAYSAFGGRLTHHHASMQVLDDGKDCRFVWIADLLPHEMAPAIAALMEQGCAALQRALEAQRGPP